MNEEVAEAIRNLRAITPKTIKIIDEALAS